MDSIKAWFMTRKPQHRSIDQQRTETKNVISETPKARSAFQPARRPKNGLPSTTSIRTSLQIRKRESVVPAKRAAETGEPLNVTPSKVPRLEQPPPSTSSNSGEDERSGYTDEGATWTPPKRLQPDDLSDDASPTKKRKTEYLKLSNGVETDLGDEVQLSIESDAAEDVSIEDTFIARLKNAEVSQTKICMDDGAFHARSSPPVKPERLSSLKSPHVFRKQLQAYRKSRTAPSKPTAGNKENMSGIGSWAGSDIIPGSRKPVVSDANNIELPKKGLLHSRKSTTPDVLEMEDHLDVKAKKRGKAKAADVPGQRQMRLHRPWRLYDEESLETHE